MILDTIGAIGYEPSVEVQLKQFSVSHEKFDDPENIQPFSGQYFVEQAQQKAGRIKGKKNLKNPAEFALEMQIVNRSVSTTLNQIKPYLITKPEITEEQAMTIKNNIAQIKNYYTALYNLIENKKINDPYGIDQFESAVAEYVTMLTFSRKLNNVGDVYYSTPKEDTYSCIDFWFVLKNGKAIAIQVKCSSNSHPNSNIVATFAETEQEGEPFPLLETNLQGFSLAKSQNDINSLRCDLNKIRANHAKFELPISLYGIVVIPRECKKDGCPANNILSELCHPTKRMTDSIEEQFSQYLSIYSLS